MLNLLDYEAAYQNADGLKYDWVDVQEGSVDEITQVTREFSVHSLIVEAVLEVARGRGDRILMSTASSFYNPFHRRAESRSLPSCTWSSQDFC